MAPTTLVALTQWHAPSLTFAVTRWLTLPCQPWASTWKSTNCRQESVTLYLKTMCIEDTEDKNEDLFSPVFDKASVILLAQQDRERRA